MQHCDSAALIAFALNWWRNAVNIQPASKHAEHMLVVLFTCLADVMGLFCCFQSLLAALHVLLLLRLRLDVLINLLLCSDTDSFVNFSTNPDSSSVADQKVPHKKPSAGQISKMSPVNLPFLCTVFNFGPPPPLFLLPSGGARGKESNI